jgi:hypothetical protein
VSTWTRAAAALIAALGAHPAIAATAESTKAETPPKTESTPADRAKADENRKKPLQRCDQLADKAQQDCLQKARQRIVEARKKREASAAKGRAATEKGGAAPAPK